jgi:hypothetical protein
MPAQPRKLTDVPEVSAYVIAHAAGLVWAFTVNPFIYRAILASKPRDMMVPSLALGIALSAVVLLLFLLLRKLMAGSTLPGKFTDLPEIAAYVIAHAAGLAWGMTVSPLIFRSLLAHRPRLLMLPSSIALSIAVAGVVLLIFLFLRRMLAGPVAPT